MDLRLHLYSRCPGTVTYTGATSGTDTDTKTDRGIATGKETNIGSHKVKNTYPSTGTDAGSYVHSCTDTDNEAYADTNMNTGTGTTTDRN